MDLSDNCRILRSKYVFYGTYGGLFDRITTKRFFLSTRMPAHAAWAGYAFEIMCLMHIPHIRRALGISGIMTEIYSWRSKSHEPGAQIDLVIERGDQVVNLCERKQYEICR